MKLRPNAPRANAPTAIAFRAIESRFQRPSASCSSVVSACQALLAQCAARPQPEVEVVEDLRESLPELVSEPVSPMV